MENNSIEAALAAGRASGEVKFLTGGTPFVVLPQDYKVEGLERLLPAPTRIRQSAQLKSLASFLAYVNKFKGADTIITAEITPTTFAVCALLDYHGAGKAEFVTHFAHFAPGLSVEWTTWLANSKKPLPQADFANFIEEQLPTIASPDAAELLELVQNLEGSVNAKFTAVNRLKDGARGLQYTETIELNGGQTSKPGLVELPAELLLKIAVFEHGPKWEVPVRLRYRLAEGRITFTLIVVDPHRVIATAADDAIKEITEKTGLTPFYGSVK